MLRLATDTEPPVLPDLQRSVRGVYSQGAFSGMRIIVGYDSSGTLRRKVEVREADLWDERAAVVVIESVGEQHPALGVSRHQHDGAG